MAEKKKILYIVEAMGGGVFTYIVDLANELVNKYDMYIAYAVRKQTPKNYKDYFDKRIHLIEVKNFGRAINAKKNTRYYIDEFHLLLKEEQTAAYSVEIWKRFRKWGGIPTGITQNIKDLLASREIENIFENSDFIYQRSGN